MKRCTKFAAWSLACGLSMFASPVWAGQAIDKLNPDETGWVAPVVAILAMIGIASISFKSSKRTHLD